MNKIKLAGTVLNKPVLSHECKGENFYKFELSTARLSGVSDVLTCVIPEALVSEIDGCDKVLVIGEIHTRNVVCDDKVRKETVVFVLSVEEYEQDCNSVELNGFIYTKPIYRETATARQIADVIIASNRDRSPKSDYIPTIFWGRNALRVANMNVGQKLNIFGRMQSRDYVKKLEDGTELNRVAYELSCSSMEVL